jgi:uncharacterized protein DUF2784
VLLAGAVAVLHGGVVLLVLTGALAALRAPWIVLVHAPVALAVLAVNLAGADCPLTALELELRERAGAAVYGDGFLGHHVFGRLGLDVTSTGTQIGTYAVAIGLNALGYGLLAARRHRAGRGSPVSRRSAPDPGRTPGAPRSRTPAPLAAARPAGPRTSSRTSAPGRR